MPPQKSYVCGVLFFILAISIPFSVHASALPSSPVSSETEPSLSNTRLAESLNLWNQLTQKINHLESENRAWEFRSNPEREDRNWWNPFWRSSAERSLQRSNELSFQIRDLEKQRSLLENLMLDQSTVYTNISIKHVSEFESHEREFRNQIDNWRFPIWIKHFNELKINTQQFKALNPELQGRRRLAFETALKNAHMLEDYLIWRQTQLNSAERSFGFSLEQWHKKIHDWIQDIESLLNK